GCGAVFSSETVLGGFLTGVGIQVGIAVLGEMLGIAVHTRRTLTQLVEVLENLSSAHGLTIVISAAVVAVTFLSRRLAPRLPGPLIAVVGAVAASAAFDFARRGVTVLGPVEGGLPRLHVPDVSWNEFLALLPVALSCFVLIVAQSAATARAYALRHGDQFDENADLSGLAAANVAAAVSGTFVVNGSPTQTAMVERSGGGSQLAHLVTAGRGGPGRPLPPLPHRTAPVPAALRARRHRLHHRHRPRRPARPPGHPAREPRRVRAGHDHRCRRGRGGCRRGHRAGHGAVAPPSRAPQLS